MILAFVYRCCREIWRVDPRQGSESAWQYNPVCWCRSVQDRCLLWLAPNAIHRYLQACFSVARMWQLI